MHTNRMRSCPTDHSAQYARVDAQVKTIDCLGLVDKDITSQFKRAHVSLLYHRMWIKRPRARALGIAGTSRHRHGTDRDNQS